MQTLVECVPNFSEGRDAGKVEEIIRALLSGPDVYLLDREMDADHNRCVITLVGKREFAPPNLPSPTTRQSLASRIDASG